MSNFVAILFYYYYYYFYISYICKSSFCFVEYLEIKTKNKKYYTHETFNYLHYSPIPIQISNIPRVYSKSRALVRVLVTFPRVTDAGPLRLPPTPYAYVLRPMVITLKAFCTLCYCDVLKSQKWKIIEEIARKSSEKC